MEEIASAIIAAAAVIAVPIIANVFTNRSLSKRLKKDIGREEKGKTIMQRLGVETDDKSITGQISDISKELGLEKDDKSITGQLRDGFGITRDEKSLTGQHKDILSSINVLVSDKTEKENLYSKFTKKQKNIAEKVDEINLFLKDWEKINTENLELIKEIDKLRDINESLQKENRELAEALGNRREQSLGRSR